MILRSLACISMSLLAGAALASSQHHPDPHHRHHHGTMPPGYDRATETTMSCRVESMDEIDSSGCPGCDGGLHLRAACGEESVDVHVGPAAYVKDRKFSLVKGDAIEVTGSRVTYEGGASLIAKEIRKGDAVLELRDAQGKPLWRQGR